MMSSKRLWYWLRSFTRSHWTVDDYPIFVRLQPGIADDDTASRSVIRDDGRFVYHPWVAQIEGSALVGFGDTRIEARGELKDKLDNYAKQWPLPRPGTSFPVRFASTERISSYGSLRDDFIKRVLQFDPAEVFVSDESALSEFPDAPDEYARRIALLYNVDVTALSDDKFGTIFSAIGVSYGRARNVAALDGR